VQRIVDGPAPETKVGHALEHVEIIVRIELNDISPCGNIFSEEPVGLAGRDLRAEGEGCQRRVALGQGMRTHKWIDVPLCGGLQVRGGLFVLGKGRDQGRNEYRGVQEYLHGRWGLGFGRDTRYRCLFGNACVALGAFFALTPELLHDIELFVCESSRVDQEIALSSEGRLLSLGTEGN